MMNLMSTLHFNYTIPNRSLWKKVSPKYISNKKILEKATGIRPKLQGVSFFLLFFFSRIALQDQSTAGRNTQDCPGGADPELTLCVGCVYVFVWLVNTEKNRQHDASGLC